jgi:hypothetical protein
MAVSSIESYDGLCGIIASFAASTLRLRCKYSIGHYGSCSWEKYRSQFQISGGTGNPLYYPDQDGFKRGFIDAVVYHNYEQNPIIITSKGKIKKK